MSHPARAAALAALLALALPASAAATPADELTAARAQFAARDYAAAIPALNLLLYPTPRLSRRDDLLEAHVLLGAAAFEAGDRAVARREFEEALFLDPELTLEALYYSAEAVALFDEVKRDLAAQAARDAERRALAEANEALQAALDAMVVIETRPFYVNLIPFGAGQFQNGQRARGLWFAASQALTGGLSAGIWLYLVGEYGLPGRVPPEDVGRVRTLQQLEIGAGAACLGLMAWGIVDALLHHRPSVRRAPDEDLLPPELRQRLRRPPAAALRLAPTLVPAGASASAGVQLTVEF